MFDTTELLKVQVEAIMDQREEILTAFIAKYGCNPDQIIQVQDGASWYVRQLTENEIQNRKPINFLGVQKVLASSLEICESLNRIAEIRDSLNKLENTIHNLIKG